MANPYNIYADIMENRRLTQEQKELYKEEFKKRYDELNKLLICGKITETEYETELDRIAEHYEALKERNSDRD